MTEKTEKQTIEMPKCPKCGRFLVMWANPEKKNIRKRWVLYGECGVCQNESIQGDFEAVHKYWAKKLEQVILTEKEWEQIPAEEKEAVLK